METLYLEKTSEIKKSRLLLENKLEIKMEVFRNRVSIEGEAIKEYEATRVLEAMGLGFSAHKALKLLEQDTLFRKINIKEFTRRKDLRDVKSRVIGKEGKTKATIENLTDCEIVISENSVGIIGEALSIDEAVTAIKNIIRGTKQANAYKYLEKMNAIRKELSG